MMLSWVHSASDARAVFATALATAKARAWTPTPSDAAGLQLLAAWSLYVALRLGGAPFSETRNEWGSTLGIGGAAPTFSRPERAQAAGALLRTWMLLARDQRLLGPVATGSTDAAGVPVGLVVIGIAAVFAQAGCAAFVADRASQVIDRELDRRAEVDDRQHKRVLDQGVMVAAQGAALNVLTAHIDREAAAGKELPLTAAERAALGSLESAQKRAAASLKSNEPYRSGRDPLPPLFGERFGTFLGSGLGLGVALAAAAAAVWAYASLKGNST